MAASYSLTPRGSCKPVEGIAGTITLIAFKAVQAQANRFLAKAGKTLLVCDGIIGVKTLAALNYIGVPAASCQQVAEDPNILQRLESMASERNLPVVSCPPEGLIKRITDPGPVVKDGEVVHPSGMSASIMGVPYWLLVLAAGGVYLKMKKKK